MDLTPLFIATSMALGLPPGLLESMCWVESNHNPDAFVAMDGNGPSHGVCQIKEAAARQAGFSGTKKDLMNPRTNIYYAGKYLKYQYGRYGSWTRAVTAYNKGRSDSHGGSAYVAKVFDEYLRRGNASSEPIRTKVPASLH